MVGGPGLASPAGATFFGLSGPRLRQVGIALVGIGLLLFFLSFVPIFLAFNSFMQNGVLQQVWPADVIHPADS